MISAWLAHHLKADYWKPIQTGCPPNSDTQTVETLAHVKTHPEAYVYRTPVSPHLAAKLEGGKIELHKMQLPKTDNNLIIEGAGGLLVPINEKETIVDLIKHLNVPIIIVARSTLGTINHTCLTIKAARSHGLSIKGVIMNGHKNDENKRAIGHYGKIEVLAEVELFEPLSDKAIQMLPLSETSLQSMCR